MYRFTTTGGREALNGDINLLVTSGFDGDEDKEKERERSFARERFSLAMHFYSFKITLCRPCLTHANARNIAPSTDIGPSHTANGDDNDTNNPKDTDTDGDTDGDDNTSNRSTSDPISESSTSNPPNTSTYTTQADITRNNPTSHLHPTPDTSKARRARFRTEMSLSCLRASCALLSLLPDEPDILSLRRLSPWWHHLHYIMQATTALLLGLSSWPTSPPAEEKYSTSVQAPVFGTAVPTEASTDPGSEGEGGTGPRMNPLPTLQVATVINCTKKALRWLYHMSVHGDTAARRAFMLSDSFMRRIAPNLGISVDDLPEVDTLPVAGSPAEGMPVPASGIGSGVEGVSGGGEEAGERERKMEVEGRGIVEEKAAWEVDREWDGVGGRIAGVYQL